MNEEAAAEVSVARWKPWVASSLLIALLAVCLLQIIPSIMVAGKVYPGVKVTGVDLGGLTYSQAALALRHANQPEVLKVNVSGKQYRLSLSQLGTSYDLTTTLNSAYAAGRSEWWALAGIANTERHGSMGYAYATDRKVMDAEVQKLVATSGQAPVDAKVVVDNGVPRIEPDKDGVAVSAAELTSAVTEAVASANGAIITLQPKPQPAKVQAELLPPVVEQTKALIAVPITLTAGDKVIRPTAAEIGKWVAFDTSIATDGQVKVAPRVDGAQVKAYVQAMANKIDVAPINKKITTENGVTKQTEEGVLGSAIDQEVLATQLATAVTNRQALTATVAMKPVPFKTVTNNTFKLDAPKYIEINLSRQHMWVYQDGNVVYESALTSGATNYGFGTSPGLFAIYYKTTNTHLIGNQYGSAYNYDVFVQYWMPFNGGEGLHDASWRNGQFGGQDYLNNGSHGCVNLPLSTAAWIYNWADIGTPVWVHY